MGDNNDDMARRARNEIRDFCRGRGIIEYDFLMETIREEFPDKLDDLDKYSDIARDEIRKLDREVRRAYAECCERVARRSYDDLALQFGDFDNFDDLDDFGLGPGKPFGF